MPGPTAIYRVQQGTDIAPVFLVVSPEGGFSQLLGSMFQAGSVARIEDAAVDVALCGEALSIFLEDLFKDKRLKISTCKAFLSQKVQEPSRCRVYEIQLDQFPMLHFGVDDQGICRTGVYQDADNASKALDEWFSGLGGGPSGP